MGPTGNDESDIDDDIQSRSRKRGRIDRDNPYKMFETPSTHFEEPSFEELDKQFHAKMKKALWDIDINPNMYNRRVDPNLFPKVKLDNMTALEAQSSHEQRIIDSQCFRECFNDEYRDSLYDNNDYSLYHDLLNEMDQESGRRTQLVADLQSGYTGVAWNPMKQQSEAAFRRNPFKYSKTQYAHWQVTWYENKKKKQERFFIRPYWEKYKKRHEEKVAQGLVPKPKENLTRSDYDKVVDLVRIKAIGKRREMEQKFPDSIKKGAERQSGVEGVRWNEFHKQWQAQLQVKDPSRAKKTTASGHSYFPKKVYSKSFAVAKYGDKEAKRLAIEARKQLEKDHLVYKKSGVTLDDDQRNKIFREKNMAMAAVAIARNNEKK